MRRAPLLLLCVAALMMDGQTRIQNNQVRGPLVELLPGSGIEQTTPFPGDGVPMRLQLDLWYAVHVAGWGDENEPANGDPCYNGAGIWLGQKAMHVCIPPPSGNLHEGGWVWRTLAYNSN